MIRHLIALAAVGCLASPAGAADAQLSAASRSTVRAGFSEWKASYREHGMNGLVALSTECFRQGVTRSNPARLDRCIAIDMLSAILDQAAAESAGMPNEPYFSRSSCVARWRKASSALAIDSEAFDRRAAAVMTYAVDLMAAEGESP